MVVVYNNVIPMGTLRFIPTGCTESWEYSVVCPPDAVRGTPKTSNC